MRTFKEYKKGKEVAVGKIPMAIHFKHTDNSGEIPAAIHFKHVKEEAPRRVGDINAWKDTNENGHVGHTNATIRKKLTKGHNVSDEEKNHISRYTSSSRSLNKKLIDNEDLPGPHRATAEALDSAINKNPIKHTLHVYSGLGFDPEEHVDKEGKVRSPAYISATHDKDTAYSFATQYRGVHHFAKITLHPGDPAIHVSPYSKNPHEDETIIKRGVTLQHNGHSDYTDPEGFKYRVHHMSIAKD